jgi:hypothetical protein
VRRPTISLQIGGTMTRFRRGLVVLGCFVAFAALLTACSTPLTLLNSWTGGASNTASPSYSNVGGVIHFRGGMGTGTSPVLFELPANATPAADVFVPVDLCNATNGRLHITSGGVVSVDTEGGVFSNAQCFTSLDGASFPFDLTNYSALTLVNGWTSAPFSTRPAEAALSDGVVSFSGAMQTSGTSPVAFTLPASLRPATDVYVPVDLCSATNGRLHITPAGVVDVEAVKFSNAQCFTSLDGASFAQSVASPTPLTLLNGWTNAPFSTSDAAVSLIGGIVHFQGAIASGTSPVPFVLPTQFRPANNVYVKVDLCGATNGRLVIQSDGTVSVAAQGGTFSNAQCFTSLDGATFSLN